MSKIQINLIQGSCFTCSERLSIGIILKPEDNSVILIDSGLEDSTAKALDTAITAQNWRVAAIVNTHSHADHCGGNAYFQKKYPSIKIYATEIESVFINNPSLEPWYLSAGASPIAELHNKFLETKRSCITNIIPYQKTQITINGISLEIIPLPGHTQGMIGIINIADRVLYAGDCLFAPDIIDKHGVLFYTDIIAAKTSLMELLELKNSYDYCVLYHGNSITVQAIKELINLHLQKIQVVEDFILTQIISRHKVTEPFLIAATMQHFDIKDDIIKYHITKTCVFAFISSLQKQGKITFEVIKGEFMISPSTNCD